MHKVQLGKMGQFAIQYTHVWLSTFLLACIKSAIKKSGVCAKK